MDRQQFDRIVNLTMHSPTPEQLAEGVVRRTPVRDDEIKGLLTFDEIPSLDEIVRRAERLADLASKMLSVRDDGSSRAMIGGAPYLMGVLEQELKNKGIQPIYAFSRRETVEEPTEDGGVKKVAKFLHQGFVEVG